MKKSIQIILIVLLAVVLNTKVQSQNLVPNPSFEIYDTCPPGQGNLRLAIGWSSYRETPDYFNSCDLDGEAGVPLNVLGFQQSRTGNAYAGFYAFSLFGQYREIIGTKLIQHLISGKKYFVSFYVNTAYNASPGWQSTFAVNKLGARFSTTPYSYSNPITIDNNSQVFTDSIIADTLNWIKIAGSFIADSAYNYVSFGNFFSNSETTYISLDTLSSFAYYYIDDIVVTVDSLFDGLNDFSHSLQLIKIIPNPARDWITIEGSDFKSFSIIDILGRKYIEDTFAPISHKTIYIGNLSKGIYLIQINTLSYSSIKKLVIQ